MSQDQNRTEITERCDSVMRVLSMFRYFPALEGDHPDNNANTFYTRAKRLPLVARDGYIRSTIMPYLEAVVLKMLYRTGELPIGPQEFVESTEYLNMAGVLYPEVMKEFIELNSGKYVEAVMTGGIGTGKSTLALFTTAYQLYLLSCLCDPQRQFGLSPTDEIVFVFQSVTVGLAKTVDYARFRELCTLSPYFNKNFPFDRNLTGELHFPNRIIVKPLSGSTTAALGQNVYGGILDEVNFMAIVEKSKMTRDGTEFDQAWENYRAIVRRRESRFMRAGYVPGIFCLVSSKQYPGEFTDVKAKEARTNPFIYVYDKRVWEVKPDSFGTETFAIFIGDDTRKPRILKPDEEVPVGDRGLVMNIPVEYQRSFEQDLLKCMRDIAGVSTDALHPYITDKEAVIAAFGKIEHSVVMVQAADFVDQKVVVDRNAVKNVEKLRFVHIDLAISGDSAGMACGYVSGFRKQNRGDFTETLPVITYDFILEIRPPKGGQIDFAKIRTVIYYLTDTMGVPIRWVTFDSFQSHESMMTLMQKGYQVGKRSVDMDTRAYDVLKQALLDGRVNAPVHERAQSELLHLEINTKDRKVDHPPRGSKDCSDAMAGVAIGLSIQREIWVAADIPLQEMPPYLVQFAEQTKMKAEEQTPLEKHRESWVQQKEDGGKNLTPARKSLIA